MTRGITRRSALAAVLAAPPIVRQANAQSQFDWKRFAGERIEVSLTANPRSQILISEPARVRGHDRHPRRRRGDPGTAAPAEIRRSNSPPAGPPSTWSASACM
jgi:hypothetical protein